MRLSKRVQRDLEKILKDQVNNVDFYSVLNSSMLTFY